MNEDAIQDYELVAKIMNNKRSSLRYYRSLGEVETLREMKKKILTEKQNKCKRSFILSLEMWKQLIYHDKQNNKLFDYYSEDDDREMTYILKVDGATIYKCNLPLTDTDIERFVSKHSL